MEFPRIDDGRNTLPYRFTYGIAYHDGDSDWFDEIVKVDVDTGETRAWCEQGCYPSEPIFVAAPGATTEHDGVVLNVVLDSRAGTSFIHARPGRNHPHRARPRGTAAPPTVQLPRTVLQRRPLARRTAGAGRARRGRLLLATVPTTVKGCLVPRSPVM